MRWLTRHPSDCDDIMEQLLRVAATHESGTSDNSESSADTHGGGDVRRQYASRSWVNLPPPPYACTAFGKHNPERGVKVRRRIRLELENQPDGSGGPIESQDDVEQKRREEAEEMSGCLVPDSEVALIAQAASADKSRPKRGRTNSRESDISPYERWLHIVVTKSVDTKVNLQLGEVTIRGNRLRLLDDAVVINNTDFLSVFGSIIDKGETDTLGWQCAVLRETRTHRWLRMLAFRHDVHVWQPPKRFPAATGSTCLREYPSRVSATELWIKPVSSACVVFVLGNGLGGVYCQVTAKHTISFLRDAFAYAI